MSDDFAAFAERLADAARLETLSRFTGGIAATDKGGSVYDPVTEADVAAERAMRALIVSAYPDHGIVGEELADRPAAGPYGWSLDPIDGTRSFICGLPTWTTLIALLRDGVPVVGVIDVPRLGERHVGGPDGGTRHGPDGTTPLRTSTCVDLSQARLASTDPALFTGPDAAAFDRVRAAVRVVRYGHDGYAYARLAAGSLDLVVEAGLKPHDPNALIPVVRAAGGVIGDWNGEPGFAAGRVIAAATPELFARTIAALTA